MPKKDVHPSRQLLRLTESLFEDEEGRDDFDMEAEDMPDALDIMKTRITLVKFTQELEQRKASEATDSSSPTKENRKEGDRPRPPKPI